MSFKNDLINGITVVVPFIRIYRIIILPYYRIIILSCYRVTVLPIFIVLSLFLVAKYESSITKNLGFRK